MDDKKIVRFAFAESLKNNGFSPIEASGGKEAIEIFRKERPDTVLLDYKMPEMTGIETLLELKKIDPEVPVVIITAHGDIPLAVEAMKQGAYDFIIKPPDFDRLALTLRRAMEKKELVTKLKNLHAAVDTSMEWILGRSKIMKPVIKQIYQIANSDFSLILQGETGTGKSFVARNIHNLSKRAKGPFITVDIGSMPETLVESELFGHEKGAFTGAEKKKKGFFEMADGGTLLIDELQNISAYVQGKLLKAAEEKRIYPLGSTQPVEIDTRIIGAANTDIREAVKGQKFREDLFYRLSEYMIIIPSLRERDEDILFLAQKFLSEAVEDLNKNILGITDEAITVLKHSLWPGNVRELKNVIRRAVLISEEEMIKPEHIEFMIKNTEEEKNISPGLLSKELTAMSLSDAERIVIKRTLEFTSGNKTKAASVLRIDYKTLFRKIKQYGI